MNPLISHYTHHNVCTHTPLGLPPVECVPLDDPWEWLVGEGRVGVLLLHGRGTSDA